MSVGREGEEKCVFCFKVSTAQLQKHGDRSFPLFPQPSCLHREQRSSVSRSDPTDHVGAEVRSRAGPGTHFHANICASHPEHIWRVFGSSGRRLPPPWKGKHTGAPTASFRTDVGRVTVGRRSSQGCQQAPHTAGGGGGLSCGITTATRGCSRSVVVQEYSEQPRSDLNPRFFLSVVQKSVDHMTEFC